MNRLLPLLICLGCLTAVPVRADDQCPWVCSGEIQCEQEMASCLIKVGRVPEALKRAKRLVGENAKEPGYLRLLARAYLADNNSFWAQRTLLKAVSDNQRDCLSLSWLAWVYIAEGEMDLAREVLDRRDCPGPPAEQARWHLLRAFMARARQKPEARDLLEAAEDAGQLFPEDRGLWLSLRSSENPGWIEPLGLRLDLLGGYTSNSKAGSPTDPGTGGSASLLTRMDLFGRLVWPGSHTTRLTLEAGLKGHGLEAQDARELSYLEMSARPGLILGDGFPRILIGYKADYLVLNRDIEVRRRFYEGHRAELELETESLTAFAGGGRRVFHEGGRTRWELDGGLGGALTFGRRLRALMAFSIRYYEALGDPYDLVGGTGLAVARIGLGSGFQTRIGATLGLDHYHNSGGELGRQAHGTDQKRTDLLLKLSAGLWSASYRGLRLGVSYEYNWRDSSADSASHNYDYQEHRLLLKTRLAFDLNPWDPETVKPKDHVALDYGIGGQQDNGLGEERIQDLLRQDETARRGSSCVE